MFPRPPMVTMRNPSMTILWSMPRVMLIVGAIRAPPKPPIKQPKTKAKANTQLTLIPTAPTISRSTAAALAILPSLLVMMTSFTRIVIVLAFVRRALTTQTIPPNIAIMGLALFLTLYTMTPTFSRINADAVQPYIADKINFQTAANLAGNDIKEFMLRQSRQADLALFVQMAKIEKPKNPMDLGLHIVIPAFVISEFRTAFEMGCLLFIPFLLIDMVIASVLLSAGMMMLPPVMISMPLKLILFILVDGWGLLAKSLSLSFR